MFGKRGDGYLVKGIDPVIALTPYLMPMRCDAQVMLNLKIEFEKLARFMAEKSREGYRITFMEIIIAAYVRCISRFPEVNRFIVNKRYYARKDIVCSFAVLQDTPEFVVHILEIPRLLECRTQVVDQFGERGRGAALDAVPRAPPIHRAQEGFGDVR